MHKSKDFENLDTVKKQRRLVPAAENIYENLFGPCEVLDLREDGNDGHILDRDFAVDTLIVKPSGAWYSLQEKYRDHQFLTRRRYRVNPNCPDFTQEYKNADGTDREEKGEWFHLGAQYYFYGWSDKSGLNFAAWVLINIPKYKRLVEAKGGLDEVGEFMQNEKHGRASFYCIPLTSIKEAIVAHNMSQEHCSKDTDA